MNKITNNYQTLSPDHEKRKACFPYKERLSHDFESRGEGAEISLSN